jgi:hypothetical protein
MVVGVEEEFEAAIVNVDARTSMPSGRAAGCRPLPTMAVVAVRCGNTCVALALEQGVAVSAPLHHGSVLGLTMAGAKSGGAENVARFCS